MEPESSLLCQSPVSIVSQTKPVSILMPYFLKIHMNITLPPTHMSSFKVISFPLQMLHALQIPFFLITSFICSRFISVWHKHLH
jgi:hypothetical protein